MSIDRKTPLEALTLLAGSTAVNYQAEAVRKYAAREVNHIARIDEKQYGPVVAGLATATRLCLREITHADPLTRPFIAEALNALKKAMREEQAGGNSAPEKPALPVPANAPYYLKD